jgi:hypothetical protein
VPEFEKENNGMRGEYESRKGGETKKAGNE